MGHMGTDSEFSKINLSILGLKMCYSAEPHNIIKINLSEKEEIFQRKMNSNQNQPWVLNFSDFLGQTAWFSWPIRFYAVRHRGFLCQIPLKIHKRLNINNKSAFQRGRVLIYKPPDFKTQTTYKQAIDKHQNKLVNRFLYPFTAKQKSISGNIVCSTGT